MGLFSVKCLIRLRGGSLWQVCGPVTDSPLPVSAVNAAGFTGLCPERDEAGGFELYLANPFTQGRGGTLPCGGDTPGSPVTCGASMTALV